MIKTFKIIALLEGISLLALFFVAMPLKYYFHNEEIMKPTGMTHGLLFILYIVFATVLKTDEKWNLNKYLLICVASIIPFGTFYVQKKLL